jgi:WD40 repeat protein
MFSPVADLLASSGQHFFMWNGEAPGFRIPDVGPSCLAFSPDGTKIAFHAGNRIEIHNLVTGQMHKMTDQLGILSIAYSPDGKFFAAGGTEMAIKLWAVRGGGALLPGHTGTVNHLTFSPDSKMLASASDDQSIRLWDLHTLKEKEVLSGHTRSVYFVSYSSDGAKMVSGSHDGTVIVWDVKMGKASKTIECPSQFLALSPNGKTVALANGASITLWDTDSGVQQLEFKRETPGKGPLAFSRAGKVLVVASGPVIDIWEIQTTTIESGEVP